MSHMLADCQVNITRLLCQVESILNQHQSKIKNSYKKIANKLNRNTSEVNGSKTTVKSCERSDLEIQLTVSKDSKGTLLIPCGKNNTFNEENNNRCIISPIPTPKTLKVASMVQVSGVLVKTPRKARRRDILHCVPVVDTINCNTPLKQGQDKTTGNMELCEALMETEVPRLDYKEIVHGQLDLDPIKCEVNFSGKKRLGRDDTLSSCDSGYENSDLDDNGCNSPRSTGSVNTEYSDSKDLTVDFDEQMCTSPPGTPVKDDKSETMSTSKSTSPVTPLNDNHSDELSISPPKSSPVVTFNVIKEVFKTPKPVEPKSGTPKSDNTEIKPNKDRKNSTPKSCSFDMTPISIETGLLSNSLYLNNPCLPTPMMATMETSMDGNNVLLQHDDDDDDNHPVMRKLEYDMTGVSYCASSYASEVSNEINHNVTFYNVSNKVEEKLNDTDLASEINDAMRKSLIEEMEDDDDSDLDDNNSTLTLVPTSISISTEVLCEQLHNSEKELLEQVDKRKDELHGMVDNWHEWIQQQIVMAYHKEEHRLKSERKRIRPVTGVNSPVKSMCTFLNTTQKLNQETFGTFHSNTAHMDRQEKRISNYFLSKTKHLRTFETRDDDTSTEYMATGLNVDNDGNYTVTDLGADTCRIFSSDGRLIKDLDIAPLDEPTYAIPTDEGHTILACRSGLKCYTADSEFSRILAQSDIKCPQSVATDCIGNYIVSDMHDCGSVIVTLEKHTLLPVRLFCGTQYDDYPKSFSHAWYVHVARNGDIVISDRDDHMIKSYSPHGEYLWSAGGLGAKPGQFFTPAGITEDKLGNILVADSNNDRVQVFTPSGKWLGVVVSKDTDEDFKSPIDLSVDIDGNLAVLLSTGTVCIYSYLNA